MTELIITRGVPASGKSTWAESWVADDPQNRVRVNLDDLRFEKYGKYVLLKEDGSFDRDKENEIFMLAVNRMTKAIREDKSVVFDAPNLTMRNFNSFNNIAHSYKRRTGEELKISTRDFPVSLEEALRRNAGRERVVEPNVIKRMYRRLGPNGEFRHIDGTYPVRKFIYPETREQAICFDMDGTLVDVRDVRHFVNRPKGKPRDFDSFHRFSLHSPANRLVVEELREAHNLGYKIVITTARQEQYREVSQKWLDIHDIPYENMFMRKNSDSRSDYLVKKDMLAQHVLPHYDVVKCVDDNPQAINAWLEAGLTVTTIPFVDDSNSHLYEGKELPISAKLFVEGVCVRCNRPIKEGTIGPTCASVR